jgi:tryptophan-rich sensory protein
MSQPFPFSAIVGQDEMKLALLIGAVDPTIGGVLVFGDRGTGKSTAVRALAALLPPMRVVVGCRYSTAAGWLLPPYLAWVTFAAALNLAVVRLNGPFPGT